MKYLSTTDIGIEVAMLSSADIGIDKEISVWYMIFVLMK